MLMTDAAVARWGDLGHRPLLAAAVRADLGGLRSRRLVGPARRPRRTRTGPTPIAAAGRARRRPCCRSRACSPDSTSPTTPTATSGTAGSSWPGSPPTDTRLWTTTWPGCATRCCSRGCGRTSSPGSRRSRSCRPTSMQLRVLDDAGHPVTDEPRPGHHHLPAGRRGLVHRGGTGDAVVMGHPRPADRVCPAGGRVQPTCSGDGSPAAARTRAGRCCGAGVPPWSSRPASARTPTCWPPCCSVRRSSS